MNTEWVGVTLLSCDEKADAPPLLRPPMLRWAGGQAAGSLLLPES